MDLIELKNHHEKVNVFVENINQKVKNKIDAHSTPKRTNNNWKNGIVYLNILLFIIVFNSIFFVLDENIYNNSITWFDYNFNEKNIESKIDPRVKYYCNKECFDSFSYPNGFRGVQRGTVSYLLQQEADMLCSNNYTSIVCTKYNKLLNSSKKGLNYGEPNIIYVFLGVNLMFIMLFTFYYLYTLVSTSELDKKELLRKQEIEKELLSEYSKILNLNEIVNSMIESQSSKGKNISYAVLKSIRKKFPYYDLNVHHLPYLWLSMHTNVIENIKEKEWGKVDKETEKIIFSYKKLVSYVRKLSFNKYLMANREVENIISIFMHFEIYNFYSDYSDGTEVIKEQAFFEFNSLVESLDEKIIYQEAGIKDGYLYVRLIDSFKTVFFLIDEQLQSDNTISRLFAWLGINMAAIIIFTLLMMMIFRVSIDSTILSTSIATAVALTGFLHNSRYKKKDK